MCYNAIPLLLGEQNSVADYICAAVQLQERYARKNEAADLRRAFDLLDIKNDGHIDAEELAETFSRLRHKIKKARALLQIQGSSFDVLISSELCMQCS